MSFSGSSINRVLGYSKDITPLLVVAQTLLSYILLRKISARKTVQWIKVLTALTENLGIVPTGCLTTICTSTFRGYGAPFWTLPALHTHSTHASIQAITHKIKRK